MLYLYLTACLAFVAGMLTGMDLADPPEKPEPTPEPRIRSRVEMSAAPGRITYRTTTMDSGRIERKGAGK